MIPHKQLTLAEIFKDCQNKFDNDKYHFLVLLDEAINLDEIVPASFISHFHARTGRPRKHQLYLMLKVLLIQRIFSIPTDSLLILFLKYSQELRDFFGLDVVPDAYKFGVITNGLGIVRDITFYNKDFLNAHPDIVIEKKSDSQDEDKSLADPKALLPALADFFQKLEKASIPLRVKLSMEDGYTLNENGIPCCPHDPTLPLKEREANLI